MNRETYSERNTPQTKLGARDGWRSWIIPIKSRTPFVSVRGEPWVGWSSVTHHAGGKVTVRSSGVPILATHHLYQVPGGCGARALAASLGWTPELPK